MKKIFTICGIAVVAFMANAQQTVVLTENFASYTAGGNTTSTGTNAPDATDVYSASGTPVANFPTGAKVYSAGGMAKLGTSSVIGTMTSKTLDLSTDGGNVVVTFDVKGWTGTPSTIVVKVTNLANQTVSYAAVMSGTPESKTVTFTGGQANSTVTFETPTTSLRAYLDNIVIKTVATGSLAVSDTNKTKTASFVKNTFVKNNEITFGADVKDVKVYNMFGQIVKEASVKENGTVNVAELTKGNYIVTGTVNKEAVSQKILKD
ncbi:Por secretion system C-terminal sorting domain [Chryseobacterium nakagawai]|uniref:T9SS C-terminal target domain-containing protein n=1 Tax=Chryseobacterium nakagawai TaxID=1241982 RepID=A0AAD0YN69_CHRNA|nr:T9SS type A sorting domain-containing protein [Chryseobacterium nakagawai]AZA90878.1 T9SS C-terminal target domain-containing protein [Chryseobacterium nakagawai]VEH22415.1 Por secretion system C-terminal sorting domain [Chryseobacterium nakagawai]